MDWTIVGVVLLIIAVIVLFHKWMTADADADYWASCNEEAEAKSESFRGELIEARIVANCNAVAAFDTFKELCRWQAAAVGFAALVPAAGDDAPVAAVTLKPNKRK